MALVSCPECSRQISDQAVACPHCGRPSTGPSSLGRRAQPLHGQFDGLAARTANKSIQLVVGVVGVVIGLVILGSVVGLGQMLYEAAFADSPACAAAKTKARLAWNGQKFVGVDDHHEYTPTEMLEAAAKACGKDPAKTRLLKWLDLH